jgi:hypothetical protein
MKAPLSMASLLAVILAMPVRGFAGMTLESLGGLAGDATGCGALFAASRGSGDQGSGLLVGVCLELVAEETVCIEGDGSPVTVAVALEPPSSSSRHSLSSSAPLPPSKVSIAWSSYTTSSWLSFHGDFSRDAGV